MAIIAVDQALRKLDEVEKEPGLTSNKVTSIDSLRAQLESLKPHLRHAELKTKDGGGDEEALKWVDEIRRVAYDLEDVWDAYLLRQTLAAASSQSPPSPRRRRTGWTDQMRCRQAVSVLTPGRRLWRQSMQAQIGLIQERLSELTKEKDKHPRIPLSMFRSTSTATVHSLAETIDYVDFSHVQELMDLLINPRVRRKRSVISITGLGGIGKTALAHRIYNHAKITQHFACRSWVLASVEQDGVVKGILTKILNDILQVSDNVLAGMNEQDMKADLRRHLRTTRYLIVMDDIQDNKVWKKIQDALPLRSEGSIVLLTTRNADIGLDGDPYKSRNRFPLKLLNPLDSWKLFCGKAFPNHDGQCPTQFKKFREATIQSCNNLPLAIVMLAGLLRNKPLDYWKIVLIGNMNMKERYENQKALTLSYVDLPHCLKSCMLYLAAYPKNSCIHAQDLIRMWIAEGFIQLEGEPSTSTNLEDQARTCLSDLIERSIVQVMDRDEFEDVTLIRMYEPLHDFACTEAGIIDFLRIHVPSEKNDTGVPITDQGKAAQVIPKDRQYRRVSLRNGVEDYLSEIKDHGLRSLLGIFQHGVGCTMELDLQKPKFLRVIDLQGVKLKSLPDNIGELVLLRYLCLRNTCITELPSTIGKLLKLQMLDLRGTRVAEITKSFWNIKSLRHVHVPIHFFTSAPSPRDSMNNLQTLDGVPSGGWVRNSLESMGNLRLLTLSKVSDSEGEVLGNAIAELQHLKSLKLEGDSFPPKMFALASHQCLKHMELSGSLGSRQWNEKLASSQLLPNLAFLSFINSDLDQSDIVMLGILPNLRSLVLWKSYRGMKLKFVKDSFCSLERLDLLSLVELKEWEIDGGALPHLQRLTISSCRLTKLPNGLKNLEKMQSISLRHVPTLKKRIQKDGEDYEIIMHIPHLFDYA